MSAIDLIGYHIAQERQDRYLDANTYPALGHAVVFPTVADAEDEIARIFERERRRVQESLAAGHIHPAAAKKAWDDKVCSCCFVEERVADWRVVWSRDPKPGRSWLSHAAVAVEIEQRIAWRDVRQVTRTTEGGLEVVHELGNQGPWTAWHRPLGGSSTWLPHLELMVVPWTMRMHGSAKAAKQWLAGCIDAGRKDR